MKRIIPFSILILVQSCNLVSRDRPEISADLYPPLCLDYYMTNSRELILSFNEELDPVNYSIVLEEIGSVQCHNSEEKMIVAFPENLIAGKCYSARINAFDLKGNGSEILINFYGYNGNVPDLLINEFSPEGSGNNPDCIEIYCRTGGEMGGVALCLGSKDNFSYRYIFPQVEVQAGDYLILHCKPDGLSEEITELTDITLSKGLLSSDSARDFWFNENIGLSGNNGVLSLLSHPRGEILDRVVYSDRTNLQGWTSSIQSLIEEISIGNTWQFSEMIILPEDAVFSGDTTGTRTLCRNSDSIDSNSCSDWHTVPTGGKSFGAPNTDSVFVR